MAVTHQTKIIVVGINHKKAPVDVRERFSLSEMEQKLLLSELKNRPEVIEAFVLSTCNRVEIYAHLLNQSQDPFFLLEIVSQIKKMAFLESWKDYFYCHANESAARHLLRVTSGLDSLVIGEKQILGQVKTAVQQAQEAALFQHQFNILTNLAIKTGKKAQSETEISWGGSSVGWAAVAHTERILGGLKDKEVLIIGAGKMSELTIQQISGKQAAKIYLMNRTHEKAVPMAQTYQAELVSLYDLKDILCKVDVAICAVNAPHYIIEKELLENVMKSRSHRSLLMIDIAVPRNIDPAASDVRGISICTVDDLGEVISQTMTKRQASIKEVEEIVEDKLRDFYNKIQKIRDLSESGKAVL